MKSLGLLLSFMAAGLHRRNVRLLFVMLGIFAALVVAYSSIFHVLMAREGQSHSWPTSVYWTLVTMTTLGFGDITFTSDTGRLFSILVLLSGVVLLLVMLPFLFIRLFYAPWLEARVRLRAPRRVPDGTHGHVILTEYDAIAAGLVVRLRAENIPYFVVEPDPPTAARLVGDGLSVIAGENDNRETYAQAAAERDGDGKPRMLQEYAVMVDAREPLVLTEAARTVDVEGYAMSWSPD